MFFAQGPQRSEAGEARTRGPPVSSQALYHWATVPPQLLFLKKSSDEYKNINYLACNELTPILPNPKCCLLLTPAADIQVFLRLSW